MNENMCELCDHKKNPDGGWCYMFRFEPTHACVQHAIPALKARNIRIEHFQKMAKRETP